MVISCNPDPDHQIKNMIQWYLDEDGYPIPEKDGVIRWFVTIDGEYFWGDTREELLKKYNTGKRKVLPLSFSFISANIYDNPVMLENNPEYLAFLEGLNPIDKARLLHGNWETRPEGSSYFDRKWLNRVSKRPSLGITCRAWDKASSEPSDIEKFPDFTASIKMVKTPDGRYTILGDYHPSNKDLDEHYKGRFRRRAGARDQIIENQSLFDGRECYVVLPVDPAAAGKVEYQESAKKLINLGKGLIVKSDPMPSNKSKLIKFTPFSSACENGLVDIVEDSFPDRDTLEQFYKELEAFDGERSTRQRKDDWPDCSASAFNYLCKEEIIPDFTLPSFTQKNPFNLG